MPCATHGLRWMARGPAWRQWRSPCVARPAAPAGCRRCSSGARRSTASRTCSWSSGQHTPGSSKRSGGCATRAPRRAGPCRRPSAVPRRPRRATRPPAAPWTRSCARCVGMSARPRGTPTRTTCSRGSWSPCPRPASTSSPGSWQASAWAWRATRKVAGSSCGSSGTSAATPAQAAPRGRSWARSRPARGSSWPTGTGGTSPRRSSSTACRGTGARPPRRSSTARPRSRPTCTAAGACRRPWSAAARRTPAPSPAGCCATPAGPGRSWRGVRAATCCGRSCRPSGTRGTPWAACGSWPRCRSRRGRGGSPARSSASAWRGSPGRGARPSTPPAEAAMATRHLPGRAPHRDRSARRPSLRMQGRETRSGIESGRRCPAPPHRWPRHWHCVGH
mmetsp:Transcript_67755/g.190999  ORF Transcript_67755/g.190999 Transcript_67755/m.190999 type:complete len:391 (+) Transcript_67755:177-1349(+)